MLQIMNRLSVFPIGVSVNQWPERIHRRPFLQLEAEGNHVDRIEGLRGIGKFEGFEVVGNRVGFIQNRGAGDRGDINGLTSVVCLSLPVTVMGCRVPSVSLKPMK